SFTHCISLLSACNGLFAIAGTCRYARGVPRLARSMGPEMYPGLRQMHYFGCRRPTSVFLHRQDAKFRQGRQDSDCLNHKHPEDTLWVFVVQSVVGRPSSVVSQYLWAYPASCRANLWDMRGRRIPAPISSA